MTTDNEKATAKILLSTDEAVLEKILRVLRENPEVVYTAMKTYEGQLMTQQREAEYQRALQQSMMHNQNAVQQLHSVYTSNTTAGNVFPNIFRRGT